MNFYVLNVHFYSFRISNEYLLLSFFEREKNILGKKRYWNRKKRKKDWMMNFSKLIFLQTTISKEVMQPHKSFFAASTMVYLPTLKLTIPLKCHPWDCSIAAKMSKTSIFLAASLFRFIIKTVAVSFFFLLVLSFLCWQSTQTRVPHLTN